MKTFVELMEEWKPFPTDRVNRQIEKKEKTGDSYDKKSAKVMKAVRDYKTKTTDFHKADQKYTGSDRDATLAKEKESYAKAFKAGDKYAKAADKADRKGTKKAENKAEKLRTKYNKKAAKAQSQAAVRTSRDKATKAEDRQQEEINKKSQADRKTAEGMMNRANLEKAAKAKPQRQRIKGPKIKNTMKKESLDFTQFLDAVVPPLYEAEGELPKCPPGYRYDPKMKMCVPKTPKDSVGPNQRQDKDMKPGNGASYNVWGAKGWGGDGYAFEERPTSNDQATGNFD